jgi:hypothetical protein
LNLTNAMATKSVPIARLREERELLSDPVRRARLRPAELRAVEADFFSRKPLLAPWVATLPLGIGAAVALAPAFDEQRTERARWSSGLLGGAGLLFWITSLSWEHPVDTYRYDVRRLRLAPVVTASGVGVLGTF